MIFHEYFYRRGEKKKEVRKKDPTHIQSVITAILQKQFNLVRLADEESEWHDTQTEQQQKINKQRSAKA